MGAPEDWPRWAVLLPHVLAATGHFDPLPGPQEQPGRQEASWLLDRAATYLQVQARLAEARPLAERAVAITEAAHGPDHPDVGTLLNNLATIWQDLGQPEKARPLAERALAITEATHGPNHPAVGTRLNNLALIWQGLGQPQKARPLAERALAITEAAYGPDHPTVARLRANLAVLIQEANRRNSTPGAASRSDEQGDHRGEEGADGGA
jgi:tetratricopeptide (TPR) repeat protein